jgi:ribosomal protein L11 methyltransferase
VALELGAASVRALDVDPDAVAVTRENADRNARGDVLRAEITPIAEVGGSFAVVLANIEAKTLVEMAPSLMARVSPGGWLVLSGILASRVDASQWKDVRAAYAGMNVEELRENGEWLAAVLRA